MSEYESRTGNTSRDKALAGWRSPLGTWVTSSLAIQALTGLWLYVAPFSVASQVQLLLHVVLGLSTLVPLAIYQKRHLAAWWRQRVTAEMILGYALLAAVATCVVTGLVVTWQSAAGPRLGPTWDLVHLISGIAATVLLPVHLVTAALRRPGAVDAALAAARRAFVLRGAWALAAAAALVSVASFALRAPGGTRDVPEGYAIPAYVADNPDFAGNPFAPSNARTDGDRMVDPALLAGSEGCGAPGCHDEILAEWQPSAHRFAAMNAPFQSVQRAFAADRTPAETRYCGGCHDPISLFAGAKDLSNQDLAAPGMQEGISCIACHSISAADSRGNADYRLTPPQPYLGTNSEGWRLWVSHFLVRAYPRRHLIDYDRNILRTPEFCGACHKQFIPEELNGFGLISGQNQYDEWLNGHWHSEDPETDLSCTDCHMRLVRNSRDPGKGEKGDAHRTEDDDAHRHHGFIATNSFIPAVLRLPHWETQVALTEEWVRGETVIEEIDDRWPRGPVASVDFVATPAAVAAGSELVLRATVVNRKAGHNFITGPLDFVRSWIHLTVTDGAGRVIDERGAIDPETRHILDAPGVPHTAASGSGDGRGTLVLEANPVDAEGNVLEEHELWRKAGGRDKRVIFPRHTDAHVYRIDVPADAVGPLRVTAQLLFRRYRQQFLDLVVPDMERESGTFQPTIVQSTAEATIDVRSRDAE